MDLFFLMEWASGPFVSHCIASVEIFYRYIGVSYHLDRVWISGTRYISSYFLLYEQVNDWLICILYWESVPFLLFKQVLSVFVIDTIDLYDVSVSVVVRVQFVIVISHHPFD